jgi:hypothetical protein
MAGLVTTQFLPLRRERKMSLAAPTDVFPLYLKQKTMDRNYTDSQLNFFQKRGGEMCLSVVTVD